MASTPKKTKKTLARTAQTGLMEELDYRPEYLTPTKEKENYDEENVKPVHFSEPTEEESKISARQEQLNADLRKAATKKSNTGGKKKRRSTKKTRKVKKHRKH